MLLTRSKWGSEQPDGVAGQPGHAGQCHPAGGLGQGTAHTPLPVTLASQCHVPCTLFSGLRPGTGNAQGLSPLHWEVGLEPMPLCVGPQGPVMCTESSHHWPRTLPKGPLAARVGSDAQEDTTVPIASGCTCSLRVQMSTMRVIWALDGTRAGPWWGPRAPRVHIQRTYVLGVPGPVAQWRLDLEGDVGHKDGQQHQGADNLPGHPPVEAGPPPCHPCDVITEPATETWGSGPPLSLSPPFQPAASPSVTNT